MEKFQKIITCKDCDKLFNLDGVKLKTVPFQSKLLDRMELKDFDKQSFNQFDNYYDYMDQLSISGESFSVLEDNYKPMLCWGIVPYWKGVAELWMIPNICLPKYKFKFHKTALKFLEHAAERYKLHRMQVSVHSLNIISCKWIEKCLFLKEGILKNYGQDKKDWILYARLF